MPSRALFLLAALLAACDHSEPPKTSSSGATTPVREPRRLTKPRRTDAATPLASAAADASSAPHADAGQSLDAGAPDAVPSALVPPNLIGPDGKPLPQTESEPSERSAWFEAGARALFRAIQSDDPSLAEAFFFPVVAYEQVKDVKDPKRDWERRLMANFRRDVHDYHQRLGKEAAGARFVGVELAKERMKWMRPRSEGNKLGYFRVTRNRLRYETASGKPASLEVTSLISWRGEWYLVHLNGFE